MSVSRLFHWVVFGGVIPLITASAMLSEEHQDPFTPADEKSPPSETSLDTLRHATFSPFTGKVKGKKVRMRLNADFDGPIVMECEADQLLSIVGENGTFYALEPPKGFTAYIFREFVHDNTVEGQRVNIRLHPDLDAPILGQLNSGERIEPMRDAVHPPKWLRIHLPKDILFYIAKDFVENVGGPEVIIERDFRFAEGRTECAKANDVSAEELRKDAHEIDSSVVVQLYESILNKYAEFPVLLNEAKEGLARFQESYLLKQRQSLPTGRPTEKQPMVLSETMRIWQHIEEGLYAHWARNHAHPSLDEFYEEQKLTAKKISGILEPYTAPVRNRPGDFLIRVNHAIVASVYSTKIDLQQLVGKEVHLVVSPRENHNFAFDAYFVLDIE